MQSNDDYRLVLWFIIVLNGGEEWWGWENTESGFNSSYCAFSAGKGPLSGQNYVPSHGKGHFCENGQGKKWQCLWYFGRKEGKKEVDVLIWCLYAGSGVLLQRHSFIRSSYHLYRYSINWIKWCALTYSIHAKFKLASWDYCYTWSWARSWILDEWKKASPCITVFVYTKDSKGSPAS